MATRLVLVLMLLGLAACATPDPIVVREPVEVTVPVPVKVPPPAALAAPYKPDLLPDFVAPSDPAAAAALTPEGLATLRAILRSLTLRDDAWRAWAAEPLAAP